MNKRIILIALTVCLAPIASFAGYEPLSSGDEEFLRSLPELDRGSERLGFLVTVRLSDGSKFTLSKVKLGDCGIFVDKNPLGGTPSKSGESRSETPPGIPNRALVPLSAANDDVDFDLYDISRSVFVKILRLIYRDQFDAFPVDSEKHAELTLENELLNRLHFFNLNVFIPRVMKAIAAQKTIDQSDLNDTRIYFS